MTEEVTKDDHKHHNMIQEVSDLTKTMVIALFIAGLLRFLWFQPFNIPSPSMEQTLLTGDYLVVVKYPYGYSHYSIPFSPPLFEGRIFFSPPKRGDVVVFRKPTDTSTDYIKRIIGLPGDIIQMRNGALYINGKAAKVENLPDWTYQEKKNNRCGSHSSAGEALSFQADDGTTWCRIPRHRETLPNGVSYTVLNRNPISIGDNSRPFFVPEGHYFMMGDNRDDSADSRFDPHGASLPMEGVGFVPEENLIGRASFIFFSTDGSASLWQPWRWFHAMRFERFFSSIE